MSKKSAAEKELMFFRDANMNPDAVGRRRHSSKPLVLKPRNDGLDMDDETRRHLLKRIRKIPVAGQQPAPAKKKPLLIHPDAPPKEKKDDNERRRSTSGQDANSSLMQSMMRRLKMLETKVVSQKHSLSEMQQEKAGMQKALEKAKHQQLGKQQQMDKMVTLIEQMAEFMNKESIKHPFYDKIVHISHMALDDDTSYDQAFVEKPSTTTKQKVVSSASSKTINIELIQQRVDQLNGILSNERKVSIKGQDARFEDAQSILLSFYSNGMLIDNRSFRPYAWNITKAFLTDILDGYFPYEFKDTYPDGVRMEVVNHTKIAFDKADHLANQVVAEKGGNVHGLANLKKEFQEGRGDKKAFLARLPKQVIRDGKLVAVRADIRNMLSSSLRASTEEEDKDASTDHLSEEALSQKEQIHVWTTCLRDVQNDRANEPYATLRFRLPPMPSIALRCLIVQIYGSETIGQLRAYVNKHINRNGAFAYRIRAYPNTWLDDDAITIQQAGLMPNASLFIQGISSS